MVGRLFPLVALLSILACLRLFAAPSDHGLVEQLVGPIRLMPLKSIKSNR